jgi:cell division protein FtsI/penicillin-binding protein 2
VYPQGDIAAHVIGYIGLPDDEDLERENVKGTSFVGKAGVESSYDDVLLGTEGIVSYQVDAQRKVLALDSEEAPTAGGSLVLTIDSEVQRQFQESLREGLEESRELEMLERAEALAAKSVTQRLAEAQAAAVEEARVEAAEAAAAAGTDTDPGPDSAVSTAEPGTDDDDVDPGSDQGVRIDPAVELASLNPNLPIDSNGVCVPIERISVSLGAEAVVSGREPRTMRLESVTDVDGELMATVSIGGVTETVGVNDSFAGTLQVLAIGENQIIVYHQDKWCPVRSVGVIQDPNDGSIIAMGSYPSFDPSVFVGGLSDDQWAALGTVQAFQNFAVQGLYAPASTFKTVPYVLAMEESFFPIDRGLGDKELSATDDESATEPVALKAYTDKYSCNGEFKFQLNDGTVQTKRDWKWPGGHGPLDLNGALEASCDLYFWDVALRLWEERNDDSGIDKENLLQEYSREFGFGALTGVDLPFERVGLIPDRTWFDSEQAAGSPRVRPDGPWVGGDLMDIAVGQGATLSTPLQLANAYSAMVNGGTLWQPRVVDSVVNADGETVDANPKRAIRKIDLDPLTVSQLKIALQQVVNNQERGTARSAFATFGDNVELVGGKTGTGEVIKAPRVDHFKQVDNAFFVGIAPIQTPKWVVAVVVERGGSGGRVAAPIARQMLQYLLNGPDGVTAFVPGQDAD